MTEDQIKTASIAYANAMYGGDKFESQSYNAKWGLIDELRKELTAPFAQFFGSCFDFSCGPGWWLPLQTAFTRLQALQEQFPDFPIRIVQIKEKFGDLRLYTRCRHKDEAEDAWGDEIQHPVPEEMWTQMRAIIEDAEIACAGRCEICGEPGEHSGGGWIKTLCPMHDQMRRARKM